MGIIDAIQGPPTTEKDRRLAWVGRVRGCKSATEPMVSETEAQGDR